MHSLKILCCLPFILFALDYLWLGLLAGRLYKNELGSFLRMSGSGLQPVVWAAFLVYIAIPLGIVLFVLPRVSPEKIVTSSLLWGAVFGLVVYTVYDMTNYSMLKDWPLRITLIDICWGCVLCAFGTLAASLLNRWFS